MPSATWSRQDIVEGAPSICFVQLKKATPTTPVFVNKSLELTVCKSGVKVTECVLQHEVSTTTVKVCTETQPAIDVKQMLEVFHKKPVCRGGPTQERFPGIKVECASVDATGFWRHRRCPILLDGPEDQCCACKTLSNTLRVHRFRKEKRRQTTRLRLPVSPSKKCKIEALRRGYKACYRAKKRLLARNEALETDS
ncbi:hypothetical protein HPB50_011093 [Hyalomma asiaticum]|uniref:Uncharacterized protein n=1 Tax=Hyalomma asiaticum TaxID=266040 RepID=A0ACB7RTX5_HYAAI|nr:hypothetical protein HPB50_011093 [Hyalomma asiaticum]